MQVAEGLAVPRQLAAVVVDDLHVDAEDRAALLVLQIACAPRRGSSRCFALQRAQRAERAHLGHAPGVQHLARRSRSWKVRIIAGGQAEPPMTVRFSVRELAGRSPSCGRAGPARPSARRRACVTLLGFEQLVRLTCRPGAGRGTPASRPIMRAAYGRPQALTWNIGTTGRIDVARRAGSARRAAPRRRRAAASSGGCRARPSGCRWCREV